MLAHGGLKEFTQGGTILSDTGNRLFMNLILNLMYFYHVS